MKGEAGWGDVWRGMVSLAQVRLGGLRLAVVGCGKVHRGKVGYAVVG